MREGEQENKRGKKRQLEKNDKQGVPCRLGEKQSRLSMDQLMRGKLEMTGMSVG